MARNGSRWLKLEIDSKLAPIWLKIAPKWFRPCVGLQEVPLECSSDRCPRHITEKFHTHERCMLYKSVMCAGCPRNPNAEAYSCKSTHMKYRSQKPRDHSNFRKKRPQSEKAILGALGEFRGILGAALGIQKVILGMQNFHSRNGISRLEQPQLSEQLPEPILELMGTHMKDFHLTLHSRSVFFKNWGGPHAPENRRCLLFFFDRSELKVTDLRWWSPICGFLRFSSKVLGFLRNSAVSCALQMLEFPGEAVNLQRSVVFCENLGFGLSLSP